MKLPMSADVRMIDVKKQFSCRNTAMVTLTIHYPQIWLPYRRRIQARINRAFRLQANAFYQNAENVLFPEAVQEYQNAQKNDYPFRGFEAVLQYEIPYNYNCHLSTYRDAYEYTGGAHGNTVRSSDTWNLRTGARLPLAGYFSPGTDYEAAFLDQILLQADNSHGDYFEDYRTRIVRYFNPKSYFLSPDGFNIYYQQYEIAPYSTGIVVFTIPFKMAGWTPSCG